MPLVSGRALRTAARPRAVAFESFAGRWARRGLSFPLYFLTAALLLAPLPLLLAAALALDVVRRRSWATTRALLFLVTYFLCECVGLLASGALWLLHALWPWADGRRYAAWNAALQRWWSGTLYTAAVRLFGLRIEAEGQDATAPGPVHVFIRHASVADTLLPSAFVANPHRLRLRYVLKRELLWDPCLDVVGQRLPNVFVHRGSDDSAGEIEAVRRMAERLGADEGTLIYPEGTRFTQRKRERILETLAASGNAALLEKARSLRYVLPPRLGGPFALLDGCPGADVLFVAHTGFEGVRSLGDLWNGAIVGRRIRIAFRRVAHADIPADRVARTEWLYREWQRIDDWIDATRRDLESSGEHA